MPVRLSNSVTLYMHMLLLLLFCHRQLSWLQVHVQNYMIAQSLLKFLPLCCPLVTTLMLTLGKVELMAFSWPPWRK